MYTLIDTMERYQLSHDVNRNAGGEDAEERTWPMMLSIILPMFAMCLFVLTLVFLYLIPYRNAQTELKPTARQHDVVLVDNEVVDLEEDDEAYPL